MGKKSRDERYGLTVVVWVEAPGVNQQTATERAFVLTDEIEGELRTDPTLGVTGVIAAQIGGPFSLEERGSDAARLAIVTVTVRVHARI